MIQLGRRNEDKSSMIWLIHGTAGRKKTKTFWSFRVWNGRYWKDRNVSLPDSPHVWRKTHKKKDGSFVDSQSQTLHQQMIERVVQILQPSAKDGESQSLSTDDLNEIYYDVVGGRIKNSTLYGLGSQAKVVFHRLRNPAGRASSSSSSEMQSLRLENQELRIQIKSMDQRMTEMDLWRADEEKKRAARDKSNADLLAHMQKVVAAFTQSQEAQDPSDDD